MRLGQSNRKETIERRYRQYLRIGPQMRARKKTHPLLFSVIQWRTNQAVDTRGGAMLRVEETIKNDNRIPFSITGTAPTG